MSIFLGNTEIGQIYLGSTEISEAYIGDAKVFDAGGGGVVGGYVADGLVFQLDGIEKGTTDTSKWVDLVGGIVFTEANGSNVHTANHIHVDNTMRLVGNIMPTFPKETHTIEVAYSGANGWHAVLYLKQENVSAVAQSWIFKGSIKNGYQSTGAMSDMLYSMANDVCVRKGAVVSTSANANSFGGRTYPVINSMNDTSQSSSVTQDIYAIRIYSRLLTTAEMISNQRIDNERFNLGLTLPTI